MTGVDNKVFIWKSYGEIEIYNPQSIEDYRKLLISLIKTLDFAGLIVRPTRNYLTLPVLSTTVINAESEMELYTTTREFRVVINVLIGEMPDNNQLECGSGLVSVSMLK